MSRPNARSRLGSRFLFVLLLFIPSILLGAGTSLAVAWRGQNERHTDALTTTTSQELTQGRKIRVKYWLGSTRHACNVVVEFPAGSPALTRAEAEEAGASLPHGIWRAHLTDVQPSPSAPSRPFFNMQAAGWPLKCVAAGGTNTGVRWGRLDLQQEVFGVGPILYISPIWTGLIVDTLLFGAAWGALLWSIAAALRRLRRRHARHAGRCHACGYSVEGIRGGVCPECGHPLPVAQANAAPA